MCVVFLAGFHSTVFAEDGESKYAVLEEVVTTARKRSEPLQDTPVASTVLGGQALDLTFHGDLKTLPFPAPNVNIATVSAFQNAVSVAIRGIENAEIDSTIDPVVGIFIDGVYMARPVASSMDLFDVEQVEILRGPQGTLFGRNTSAGALQIRTRRPSGEFASRGKINVGEYGRMDVRASVDLPIVQDKVNAKIAVMSQTMDGYFTSNVNGRDLGAEEILSVRPMIEFKPNDHLDITLIGEYHKNKSEPRPQQNESPSSRLLCILHSFCGFPFDNGSEEFDVDTVDVGFINAEIWGLTAETNYQIDKGVFTFIGNYRKTEEEVVYDPDAVLYPMFLVDRDQPHEQWSTEFRFQSTGYEKFDFVAGLYYFHQEYELERNTTLGVASPTPLTHLLSITGQDHDAWSVFGEMHYFVNDKLTVTVGARYSEEEKDYFQKPFGPFPNTGAQIDNSESWSDFGPKFGVNYQWNSDLMTYFSYTKGFKSGGFNGRCGQTATCLLSFDPEEVDGYELGLKADWLDNRLRTNVAVFWSEFKDLQRTAIVPLPPGAANPQETVTDNAAGATISGIELELTALIGNNFRLNFTVGILDAEYDSFCADIDGAATYTSMPMSNCGGVVTQTTGAPGGEGAYLVDEDRTGFDLGRAPETNYSINAMYDLPLSNGGNMMFHTSYIWVDDLFTDDSEVSLRENTHLLDASISYEDPDGRFRVSLYGKNLTDELYVDTRTIVPPLFDTRAVSSPRRYGIEFGWSM